MLGRWLVHVDELGVRRAGRIVETEAYAGPDDAASHAHRGARGRAALMWGPPGFAYVYLIYGMWHCLNAVAETDGYPGAVLVRAVEPLANVEQRTNGPGLLCRALHIDRTASGLDLTGPRLFLEEGVPVPDDSVRVGTRIGVDYAGDWASRPWRFWVGDSPHVSRRVAGTPFLPPA